MQGWKAPRQWHEACGTAEQGGEEGRTEGAGGAGGSSGGGGGGGGAEQAAQPSGRHLIVQRFKGEIAGKMRELEIKTRAASLAHLGKESTDAQARIGPLQEEIKGLREQLEAQESMLQLEEGGA